ncbi:MAG: radical SAM protein, partial [Phycisphaerae bacterium]
MNSSPQSNLSRRVSDELLPRVRQPAQYIGREINQLVRDGDWQRAELRVAIAFPDTYAVGICHLGCQIIYWLCNQLPGVCAERVYCPWVDAERVMRDRRIGLFTWDTRQPVAQADILAVSIQHEMCYTNVLTLLDLAGIPLRASDRHETHPLVLAGGIQADNPEPLADFLDLVVIGDAEGSLPALLEAYRQLKRRPLPRREIIIELARRFEWLYAPALYDVSYNPDGTIAQISPNTPGIAPTVLRCRTRDLEQAPLPEWPLLPYVQPAQDRISIEIMRGCPHRCRFCQVGYTRAPLALRSVQRIVEIAEQAWQATGHEQIGLLSLSSADYPHLKELAEQINRRFAARQVNISLPSLR